MKKLKIGAAAIALLLAVSLISGVVALGAADASEELSSYSAVMYADGNGVVTCEFDVSATGVANEVGATQVVIQRKDGSSWVTAQTFTYSSTSGMIGTSCLFHIGSVSHSGTAAKQYRASVTVYARIGSGSTSRTFYTNTVTAT
jgi:hypothetical protein